VHLLEPESGNLSVIREEKTQKEKMMTRN